MGPLITREHCDKVAGYLDAAASDGANVVADGRTLDVPGDGFFLGVSLRVFVLATLIGIIPGTFVYATVGAGLGSLFDAGQPFTAAGLLTPEIVIALVGLAVLALIPVAYRKWSRRRERASGSP